ncbi:MAG TPA: hypothetical protein VF905_09495 [Nitrospirota bacterium]
MSAGDLPRAGFVQPVEFIGVIPSGSWVLIASGQEILPNGTTRTLYAGYSPAPGEVLLAIVSPTGSTNIAVHNDNTNQNPGTSDVHWCLVGVAGAVNLVVRSGNQGGGTINWALYSIHP